MGTGLGRKREVQPEAAAGQLPAARPVVLGGARRRETVRLTFSLGRELHTRLKLEAVRRGETLVAMVSRWVAESTPAL